MLATARRRAPRTAWAVAAGVVAAASFGISGCSAPPPAPAVRITLSSAYLPVPDAGTTVAYLMISNNGEAADRLVAARISAGGEVVLRAPAGPAGTGMHTISSIPIPAHSTIALKPDGYHLLITGTGPIHGGRDVRLTLVFARAGPVSVLAQPTNPQTGGSTILFN
ncbi:MAG TPA: copper chaperone PCu(A)C [Streptosporangiaceae bacterium]